MTSIELTDIYSRTHLLYNYKKTMTDNIISTILIYKIGQYAF